VPSLAIICRRHAVFRLFVCPCLHDHILKVCEHDMLKTARENFTKFRISTQLRTKMKCLDFKVKRSKVKAKAKPHMVK